MALATVAIISIGDMGVGIARLLQANSYKVITNASDRSQATQTRAIDNGVELVPSDVELCNRADYILSIVPPRDALATTHRILNASRDPAFEARPNNPRYYLDVNAISPRAAREIDALFTACPAFHYIDGGIIGGPPRLQQDGTWTRPSIPLSGPHQLAHAAPSGTDLAEVLNVKHVNATIGSATGLKMCFASLSKGFTALAIQSLTAAEALGVAGELREHLDEYSPGVRNRAEKGVVSMQTKAYRWVNEMEQIAETFEAEAGFEGDESVFRAIASVYQAVADGELGQSGRERADAGDVARTLLGENERRKTG